MLAMNWDHSWIVVPPSKNRGQPVTSGNSVTAFSRHGSQAVELVVARKSGWHLILIILLLPILYVLLSRIQVNLFLLFLQQ